MIEVLKTVRRLFSVYVFQSHWVFQTTTSVFLLVINYHTFLIFNFFLIYLPKINS
jgi:hypothetical protein